MSAGQLTIKWHGTGGRGLGKSGDDDLKEEYTVRPYGDATEEDLRVLAQSLLTDGTIGGIEGNPLFEEDVNRDYNDTPVFTAHEIDGHLEDYLSSPYAPSLAPPDDSGYQKQTPNQTTNAGTQSSAPFIDAPTDQNISSQKIGSLSKGTSKPIGGS